MSGEEVVMVMMNLYRLRKEHLQPTTTTKLQLEEDLAVKEVATEQLAGGRPLCRM
jgi:hypothetical protein